MKLQLTVQIPKYPFKIDHDQKVFFVGSCFSEHISEKMSQHGFYVYSNPWGILFNPCSIGRLIQQYLRPSSNEDYIAPVFREKKWFSLHQHSQLHADTKEQLVDRIEVLTRESKFQFQSSDVLIFTFGTSIIYENIEQGQVVANCQKMPQQLFKKRYLSIEEIVSQWESIIEEIPDKKIIFTVSPVRHSKEGLIENQQSKSILHLAIYQLVRKYPEKCFYFPSFEIMMDELRDYRFYASDMVHPTSLAVDYIWEKWVQSFFTSDTLNMSLEFNKLYLFSQHRPMYGDVDLHVNQLVYMIEKCKIAYPNMNYLKIMCRKEGN